MEPNHRIFDCSDTCKLLSSKRVLDVGSVARDEGRIVVIVATETQHDQIEDEFYGDRHFTLNEQEMKALQEGKTLMFCDGEYTVSVVAGKKTA